ncbi:MAG: hypothetical protein ACOC56_01945 [Atribacterota bacterium]
MRNVVRYSTKNKNSNVLEYDNEKNVPNKRTSKTTKDKYKKYPYHLVHVNNDIGYKRVHVEKNVCALDFETLTTKDSKVIPVMLGMAFIDKKGKLKENLTGIMHNSSGKITDHKGYVKEGKMDRRKIDDNAKLFLDYKPQDKQDILNHILNILTHDKLRSDYTQCFFYNLKFDLGAIISCMNAEQYETLYMTDEVIINGFKIKIAGTKFFSIEYKYKQENGKNRTKNWNFYDLLPFTMTTLDQASKEWLGENIGGKTKDFDTAKVFNNYNILKEKYVEASEYCINDCVITAKLALEVKETFEKMGIPFVKPISPASLFKSYLAEYEYEINAFNNKNVQDMSNIELFNSVFPRVLGDSFNNKSLERIKEKNEAYYASIIKRRKNMERINELCYEYYYGGLFEMYRKGYFSEATGFDYTSMYPSIMVDLPHLHDLIITDISNWNDKRQYEKLKRSEWGIVKCKIWTKEEKIQVIPVNAKVRNEEDGNTSENAKIRPVLQGHTTVVSKQFFDFLINDYPHLEKIEIIEAYALEEKENCRKPFSFMKDLFNLRLDIIEKHGKSDKRQLVIKTLLNSGYGVTAETVSKNMSYIDDDENIQFKEEELHAGKLMRPFYAFHITEHARLKIYKDIFKNGLEKEVIGVATDCIFVEKKGTEKMKQGEMFNSSGKKKLGFYEIEKQGKMIVIGNGVYQFKEGNKVQKQTRSYNDRQFPNLFQEEELQKDIKITVPNIRPKGWKEVAKNIGKGHLSDYINEIGLFREEEKECNLNMDNARQWEREFENVSDVQNSVIESKPLKI